MLTCQEVTRVCSDELERRLRLSERVGLNLHLMMCADCRHYRDQSQTLHLAMQTYAQGMAPSGSDDDDAQRAPEP